jgi:hypothetical protein
VAGLSLCLLLVAGVVVWTLTDSDPYVAPRPSSQEDPVDAGQASRTLGSLQQAVRQGDRAGAEALAPTGDDGAAQLMAAIVANARSIPVRDFRLRYIDETSAASADGTWGAAVTVTWQFAGFDPASSQSEVTFWFRRDGDRVALVAIGGGDERTPVWLTGPLTVRRTSDTLVLDAGRGADTVEDRARAAVSDVRAVLPQWRTGLVVEVPAGSDALDAALDAAPGEYTGIAAVTSSTDGSVAPDSPIHVFINPTVFDRLGATGAQVVMSHEAVHVATKAPNSTMPQWLLEGFADYVALRDVDLPFSVTAAQITRQVRREGAPKALPGPSEFGSTDTHLGAAYEAAWLACVVLADHGGEDALVGFYAALNGGSDLIEELRQRFGWTEGELVAAWRQRLTELAA